jgi:hypothetical protein
VQPSYIRSARGDPPVIGTTRRARIIWLPFTDGAVFGLGVLHFRFVHYNQTTLEKNYKQEVRVRLCAGVVPLWWSARCGGGL